jgi:hypothetical protein
MPSPASIGAAIFSRAMARGAAPPHIGIVMRRSWLSQAQLRDVIFDTELRSAKIATVLAS